jgi:hypothetical protein
MRRCTSLSFVQVTVVGQLVWKRANAVTLEFAIYDGTGTIGASWFADAEATIVRPHVLSDAAVCPSATCLFWK